MYEITVDYKQLALDVATSIGGSMQSYREGNGTFIVDVMKENETTTYCLDGRDIEGWLMTNLVPLITARHYAYA